jgi:hypothetical protein
MLCDQIVNEGFVEDINSILNAGDLPNLFASDERDGVIADCRELTPRSLRSWIEIA